MAMTEDQWIELRPSVEITATFTFEDADAYRRLLYGAQPLVGEIVGGSLDGLPVTYDPRPS